MSNDHTPARRVHRVPNWPHLYSEKAFDTCALRLDSNDRFDSTHSSFVLGPEEEVLCTPLELDFNLPVVSQVLADNVGHTKESIDVLISLWNRGARHAVVLQKWAVGEVPTSFTVSVQAGEFGPGDLDIRLSAVLTKEASEKGMRAVRLGSTLAERIFHIRRPIAECLFPVHYTSFSSRGWPKKAAWNVDFLQLDACHEESEGILEVHINKDLPALHKLMEIGSSRKEKLQLTSAITKKVVTAEVLGEVAVRVLAKAWDFRQEETEIHTDSFAHRLAKGLGKALKSDEDKLFRQAHESPADLRMAVQNMLRLGDAFNENALRKLEEG